MRLQRDREQEGAAIISRMQEPGAQAGDKARIAQKIKAEQRRNSKAQSKRPSKSAGKQSAAKREQGAKAKGSSSP